MTHTTKTEEGIMRLGSKGKAEGRIQDWCTDMFAKRALLESLPCGGASTVPWYPGTRVSRKDGEPGRFGTRAKTTPGYAGTGTAKRAVLGTRAQDHFWIRAPT
eukprot:1244728-Rhodomonas_salina.1